jgi:hypothetical protein
MAHRNLFGIVKRVCKNTYTLVFINGFLLASLLYFNMQSSYEDGLFSSIRHTINDQFDSDDNSDSVAVKAMHVCHNLMGNRAPVFGGKELGIEADFFSATSVDLMTTRGACGSYAMVLARVLEDYHFPVRIAQMFANGVFAGHNVVEVNTGNGWVVLDPTFDVSFVRPDAHLASFSDVQHNWTYYASQVPQGYNPNYRYEDVRYTNWSKVPVIFPAVRSVLRVAIGSRATDTLSIRTWFLKIYKVYFYITLLLFVPLTILTIRRILRGRVLVSRQGTLTSSLQRA